MSHHEVPCCPHHQPHLNPAQQCSEPVCISEDTDPVAEISGPGVGLGKSELTAVLMGLTGLSNCPEFDRQFHAMAGAARPGSGKLSLRSSILRN